MQAYEVIARKVSEVGISNSELARRIGMNKELLRRSLIGERKINADEFVKLCEQLELDIKDFI